MPAARAILLLLAIHIVAEEGRSLPPSRPPIVRTGEEGEDASGRRAQRLVRPLELLASHERSHWSLDVILGRDAATDVVRSAVEIEGLWNAGWYDPAMRSLRRLCDIDLREGMGLALSRREPVSAPLAKVAETDIRVGERDTIVMQSLQRDGANGSLFVAQLTHGDGSASVWTAHLSTDKGVTWRESYMLWADHVIGCISTGVAAGHFYVGFPWGVGQNEIRLCRFRSDNGGQTPFGSAGDVVTIAAMQPPERYAEVVMGSNHTFTDDRLYCGAVTGGNALQLHWSMADGANWSPLETNVRTARSGLSYVFAYSFAGGMHLSLWFSYISTSNDLCIDRYTLDGYAPVFRAATKQDNSRYTSISAYEDTVFCAYESAGFCRYVVSYGSGSDGWQHGVLGGDSIVVSDAPAVTLEGRGGIGIAYRVRAPVCEGRFLWRAYGGGPWTGPVTYTDHEPDAARPGILYVGKRTFGMLYLSLRSPVPGASFFDTYTRVVAAVADGVADVPEESALEQNYPNPLNPTTTIAYTIAGVRGKGSGVSHVRLVVYDCLGREVAVLADELKAPGSYEATFDASGLASGVYLYRMQTGDRMCTRKMILLR